jgi:K+-transporting ATPase ATPase C chain
MRVRGWLAVHLAALRVVVVLTLIVGLAYPLGMTVLARIPGLSGPADGSLITGPNGRTVGSVLIGQSFTDAKGNPIPKYFQTRPSMAGNGYDPTASGASNLGPDSIVDTLPNPADKSDTGKLSLLSQICQRSKAIGELEGVNGARPYCTADGVGAVLGVFRTDGLTGPTTRVVSLNQECPVTPFMATYQGVRVECAQYGADYGHAVPTPIAGNAPTPPAVPSDAVTASGSGLDPDISLAYANLQAPRVARARGISLATLSSLVDRYTTGRPLGVLGEPVVNVVRLNLALDQQYPKQGA